MNVTLEALADSVNAWCDQRRLRPANGQAAAELSVRTLRYYRTVNLLDGPVSGGGAGYGKRHFLQACAVRVLQAQGLPLSRIQSLLFGRSDADLQTVLNSVESQSLDLPDRAPASAYGQPEAWKAWRLSPDFTLICHGSGEAPTAAQIDAIQQILQPSPMARRAGAVPHSL